MVRPSGLGSPATLCSAAQPSAVSATKTPIFKIERPGPRGRAATNPLYYDACGQELFVSAPDPVNRATTGKVAMYWADGDSGNALLEYRMDVTPQASMPVGAEFGFALATARFASGPHPWEVAGEYVDWIAVGAPGADRVELHLVDPTKFPPLAYALTINAPAGAGGKRFGQALAAGDFNGDGLTDLAVAAPRANGSLPEGKVYVYRATGATTFRPPLEVNGFGLTGSATGGVEADDFGAGLAAGDFVGHVVRDALVVGAPLSGPADNGGLCQFTFENDASAAGLTVTAESRCYPNNLDSVVRLGGAQERLGTSVAVGNFHSQDPSGDDDSPEALLEEVAAGRPGYQAGEGAVTVFLTREGGIDFAGGQVIDLQEPGAPGTPSRFGTAVGGGYIADSLWADLVIGMPNRSSGGHTNGGTALTSAEANGTCKDISGEWEADDEQTAATGERASFRVRNDEDGSGKLVLTFEEDYHFSMYTDPGTAAEAKCDVTDGAGGTRDADFFLPAGFMFELPGAYVCSSTSPNTQVWTGVDALPFLLAIVPDSDLDGDGVGDVHAQINSAASGLAGSPTLDITMTFDAAGNTLGIDVPINGPLNAYAVIAALALQASSVLCAFGDFPIEGEIVTYEECE